VADNFFSFKPQGGFFYLLQQANVFFVQKEDLNTKIFFMQMYFLCKKGFLLLFITSLRQQDASAGTS